MKKIILLTLFTSYTTFQLNAQCTVAAVVNPTSVDCEFMFIGTSMSAASFGWSFGDGDSISTTTGTHTYTSDGTYNACFVGYDAFGAVCDSQCININAVGCTPPPCTVVGTYMLDSGCTYNFLSSAPGASSVLWTFGDGYTSTNANPSHTYFSAGTFSVCLYGFNASGDTCGSHCMTVTTTGCAPSSCVTTFTTSSISGCNYIFLGATSGAATFEWDFGDGTTSSASLASIIHNFPADGMYTVCLNGYDSLGNLCGTYCQMYTVTGCGTLEISEYEELNSLSLYPNPANELITISVETQNAFAYRIFDAGGKLVRSEFSNKPNAQIDIRTLNNGYYTIVAYTYFGEKLGSKRFIKSN